MLFSAAFLFCGTAVRRQVSAGPALEVVLDHIAQRIDVCVIIIKARNVGEVLAARFFKAFLDFFINLFKRFDAIGRESRCANGDVLLPAFRQSCDLFDRIGLQPLFGTKL